MTLITERDAAKLPAPLRLPATPTPNPRPSFRSLPRLAILFYGSTLTPIFCDDFTMINDKRLEIYSVPLGTPKDPRVSYCRGFFSLEISSYSIFTRSRVLEPLFSGFVGSRTFIGTDREPSPTRKVQRSGSRPASFKRNLTVETQSVLERSSVEASKFNTG